MGENPYFNNSGCADSTAYEALKPLIKEETALDKKVHNLINVLKFIIDWVGFELIERIEVRDKKDKKGIQMKPIETSTTNAVYTLEGCYDLPVTKYMNVNNQEEGVESVWELSPDDLKKIQETGKIYLYIQGKTIPPVLLTTESQVYFPQEEGKNNENNNN